MTTDESAAVSLARHVLRVLDMQCVHEKASGPRRLELIGACKAAERELRKACEALAAPKPAPSLFPEEDRP